LLDDDLDFVRGALATIEEIGRGAMEELDDVLGLLRAPERARRVPQPTLAELDRLVADARATDLEGAPRGRRTARAAAGPGVP
jgi:hypothetical protein